MKKRNCKSCNRTNGCGRCEKEKALRAFVYTTASHRHLVDQWLRTSLPNDLQLTVVEGEQACPSGEFVSDGWNTTMREKVRINLRAIEETFGDRFLHVDSDVQFFGSFNNVIDRYLETYDIVAQDDGPEGNPMSRILCGGFFACRSTPEVRTFWERVLERMDRKKTMNDQTAFNQQAKNSALNIGILPRNLFWSPRRMWEAGSALEPPQSIVMHHANWTIGIENKVEQLRVVRTAVNSRLGLEFHGSDYGGYHVHSDYLNSNSCVYSFGVGEDSSFELSLAERYQCRIFAFDPTPRAIVWAERNLEGHRDIQFEPVGILDRSGKVPFNLPRDESHVSGSIFPISQNSIEIEVQRLTEVMSRLGHQKIDLLKLDIEGAEIAVLRDMLHADILPSQIVVEFHPQITGPQEVSALKAELTASGYRLLKQRHQNYTWLRQVRDQ